MATLTVQSTTTAGVVPAAAVAAAGGGDQFSNDGNTALEVINGGVGSINVTIEAQKLCERGTAHDIVVAVGAGATKHIGPFDPAWFNDVNSMVQITYSGVTDVTVRAFKV